jgi:hypothetical protein
LPKQVQLFLISTAADRRLIKGPSSSTASKHKKVVVLRCRRRMLFVRIALMFPFTSAPIHPPPAFQCRTLSAFVLSRSSCAAGRPCCVDFPRMSSRRPACVIVHRRVRSVCIDDLRHPRRDVTSPSIDGPLGQMGCSRPPDIRRRGQEGCQNRELGCRIPLANISAISRRSVMVQESDFGNPCGLRRANLEKA